jgi:amino acid transporter
MADLEKALSSDIHKGVSLVQDSDIVDEIVFETKEVKRDLKPRQITMIAIGGTIGTGLFIGTGTTLATAGPVSSLISFLFITTIAYSVTQSIGEMATYIPVTGSFSQFAARWCSPAIGAATGWNYWFSWAITFALELSVVGQIIQLWTYEVPLAAWIGIFFVILVTINLFPVKFYGEIEFWVASIKVIAIVGWLIYALCMVCGAGSTGPIGFRYWRKPGPWGPGLYTSKVAAGRFCGWLQSLISTAFTFQGTETIGIAAGESRNPSKTIPSAIRKLLFRILVFFVLSMLFIGLLIPWNDERLGPNVPDGGSGNYTSSSPFIIAMQISGTKILPDIFNAVILTTIISAGNSNIYFGSRILYGLAEAKVAPKFFLLTNKGGVPYVSVLVTASIGALGFLSVSNGTTTAFNWLLNISATAGLIAWGGISFAHIRFMSILKSRNIHRDTLPFKAAFMPYSAWYAFIVVVIITFIQGFGVFFDFNVSDFFTNYISLILFCVCWIGFHFYYTGKNWFRLSSLLIKLDDCDIDTGVRQIEDDQEWIDQEPKNLWDKFWDFIS